jgi:hypothetical protein
LRFMGLSPIREAQTRCIHNFHNVPEPPPRARSAPPASSPFPAGAPDRSLLVRAMESKRPPPSPLVDIYVVSVPISSAPSTSPISVCLALAPLTSPSLPCAGPRRHRPGPLGDDQPDHKDWSRPAAGKSSWWEEGPVVHREI